MSIPDIDAQILPAPQACYESWTLLLGYIIIKLSQREVPSCNANHCAAIRASHHRAQAVVRLERQGAVRSATELDARLSLQAVPSLP